MLWEKLYKNICDSILEGQIKLGYIEEDVRLYYMKDSLVYLLNQDKISTKDLINLLEECKDGMSKTLGAISISNEGNRFCFFIPKNGVRYIHEYKKTDLFLQQLVNLVHKPNCTLDDVRNVFYEKSKDVVCEKIDNGEFDYVIYFKNEEIDDYRYCFNIGEMGVYYHRFIRSDYNSIMEE